MLSHVDVLFDVSSKHVCGGSILSFTCYLVMVEGFLGCSVISCVLLSHVEGLVQVRDLRSLHRGARAPYRLEEVHSAATAKDAQDAGRKVTSANWAHGIVSGLHAQNCIEQDPGKDTIEELNRGGEDVVLVALEPSVADTKSAVGLMPSNPAFVYPALSCGENVLGLAV